MKKFLLYFCFLFCTVSCFAVEKSRTFGNLTVYFDTEDVGKYYENPQKAALEKDLVIFGKIHTEVVEAFKNGYADLITSKLDENEISLMLCLKVITTNDLAGGRIYNKKEKLQISVFKDSEGNLYYAN